MHLYLFCLLRSFFNFCTNLSLRQDVQALSGFTISVAVYSECINWTLENIWWPSFRASLVGLGDISNAIVMRISSVKPVLWLVVKAFIIEGDSSTIMNAILRSLSVNYGSVY